MFWMRSSRKSCERICDSSHKGRLSSYSRPNSRSIVERQSLTMRMVMRRLTLLKNGCLQACQSFRDSLTTQPGHLLYCLVRGRKAAGIVIEEIEYQAMQNQQDVVTDWAPVASGNLAASVPFDHFVIDANGGLLDL
jgi:hypothetical protein